MLFSHSTVSPQDFEKSLYERTEAGILLKKKKPDLYLSTLWNGHLETPQDLLSNIRQEFRSSLEILIHGLLLYRKIVIPTNDFLVLEPLIKFLGSRIFQQLIEQNRLKFVRVQGNLGFWGGKILASKSPTLLSGLDTYECIQAINRKFNLRLNKVLINRINQSTHTIPTEEISWTVHAYTLHIFANDEILKTGSVKLPTNQGETLLPILSDNLTILGNSSQEVEDATLQKIISCANANLEAILCDSVHCSTIFNDAQLNNHIKYRITNKKLNAEDNNNRLKEFLTEHNASLLTLKHMALREDPAKLDALLKLLLCNDAEILRQEFQALLLKPEDLSTYDLEIAYKELINKNPHLNKALQSMEFICSRLKFCLPFAPALGPPWDMIANATIPIVEQVSPWIQQKKPNPQRLIRKIQSLTD
jgi:hypothetical protein